MINDCPNDISWQAYIDEELSLEDRTAMKMHLLFCQPCSQLVSNLRTENQWLTQLFGYEDEVLSLSAAGIKAGRLDTGIKWGWVLAIFLMLGLMAAVIGGQLLESSPIIYWLQSVSSPLLSAARQQATADIWQLLVTMGVQILSVSDGLKQMSLVMALISTGFGLVGMRVLSRAIFSQEEVLG